MRQPDNNAPAEQASAKTLAILSTAGATIAVFDSLRSLAGVAGGITTVVGAVAIGDTTLTVVDASAINAVGQVEVWLYDPATYVYEKVKVVSSVTGGPETITLSWGAKNVYTNAVVSATPPFDDVLQLDFDGFSSSGAAPQGAIILCNADPAAVLWADLFGAPPAFVPNHIEIFTTIASQIIESYCMPKSACPSRYMALVASVGNWDGIGAGATDQLIITAWRKRISNSVLYTI